MLASEDKKKALTSPSSVFKHPADVVACGDLTKAEKTAILKQWELDARLLHMLGHDGLASGRHFINDAHVQIAVDRQSERTRDGSRGHYEHVRMASLFHQFLPLSSHAH